MCSPPTALQDGDGHDVHSREPGQDLPTGEPGANGRSPQVRQGSAHANDCGALSASCNGTVIPPMVARRRGWARV